jgi:hypothetical protein
MVVAFAGLTVSNVSPDAACTHCPPISIGLLGPLSAKCTRGGGPT